MGNLQPSCMKTNEGTIISVRSRCFEKPIKIFISDDDDDALEHIEKILGYVRDKKTALRSESQ